eukprot:2739124-Pyramimonas_sp.AAC.1
MEKAVAEAQLAGENQVLRERLNLPAKGAEPAALRQELERARATVLLDTQKSGADAHAPPQKEALLAAENWVLMRHAQLAGVDEGVLGAEIEA